VNEEDTSIGRSDVRDEVEGYVARTNGTRCTFLLWARGRAVALGSFYEGGAGTATLR
jgi:hypothetical protein